ncbi:MAG TPA: porin [Kofleriaceae bacterium]|nr:porin [Kofleriaceae bacterium]
MTRSPPLALIGLEALLASLLAGTAAAQPPAPLPQPAVAPSPSPPPPVAADDGLDGLGDLGLEQALPAEDEALTIYGFADVTYMMYFLHDDAAAAALFPKENRFAVGNLNLYARRALSDSWRLLAEVRFLYAPNGATHDDGTIDQTSTNDPADFDRPLNWGGIEIERVYIEYDVHPRVTIQVGSFLTPYGIWNVDHGSPAIIGTSRPYAIGEALFPERQTGLHAYGTLNVGEYTVGYHATLSNGRGPYETFRDLDQNKAVGGRLTLEAPWAGTLKLGASAYGGRFTDRDSDISVIEDGKLVNTTPKGVSYDERAFAADALWTHGRFHLQTEIITRHIAYRNGARGVSGFGEGFAPDSFTYGTYGLGAYRFERYWNITPFIMVDYYRPIASQYLDTIATVAAGLNFRPLPSVVLKAMYGEGWFPGAPDLLADVHLRTMVFQVACIF